MTILYNGDLYNYREMRAEAHIFPMMSRTGIRPLAWKADRYHRCLP